LTFSVHVVFGHVVSGQDVVRQIEDLPVDNKSRPMEEAAVKACGELVKAVKGEEKKKVLEL
jgi:peptidyl-prolyl isomerase G (cyclophilin G)